MMRKYLIFDTETGGIDSEKDALMSIGTILIDKNLNEVSRFYGLMQNWPEKNISPGALEMNGLNPSILQGGIDKASMVKLWFYLQNDAVSVIGHNLSFDLRFVNANGFFVPEFGLDTMHAAWDVWKYQKVRLTTCYERIGKKVLDAHNALYDCQMTHDLLKWYVENGHLSLPLPKYPVVHDYYSNKAFGYKSLIEKGLISGVV